MSEIKYIKGLDQFEGLSLTEITERTKHCFNTVKKYVDFKGSEIKSACMKPKESKLDPYKPEIDSWLVSDLTAPRKQRHTAQRVYDRLCEKYGYDFDVSLRIVQYYVSAKKKELYRKPEGFLPLEHPEGEAQADFGEAIFCERGVEFKGYYINLSYPNSNGGYVQVFRGQNQECLLQGLKDIFEHVGKVPYKIWFDNLSAAVAGFKDNGERKLVEQFEKFSMHYKFKPEFCNPARGNEKGNVEAKVGYHRRNMFVPIPHFSSLDEFNKYLLNKCDQDMDRIHYKKGIKISTLFENEKVMMFNLPGEGFDVHRFTAVVTDAYGKLKFDNNTYSSSPQTSLCQVWVKSTADAVIVLDKDYIEIVRHKRRYGKNEEVMDWIPYLSTLAKRPKALKYTGFYRQLPNPWQVYFEKCDHDDKRRSLGLLVKMVTEKDMETATDALLQTLQNGLKDPDSILTTYYRIINRIKDPEALKIADDIPEHKVYKPNFSDYDNLLKGGDRL